ncbi:hypothetical protein FHS76_003823 [Ochrobactrum daejeonense]|uniref:Polysaccharide pyruvyl transferase domain-containing protein n=1 Tax=Brucella daejeonensis TaxID=659015 RepID=A0A7W9B0B3_9HYPH|nr:polysaccharide pyruvyl transferase family protein [Brucella daejeonensis]MBB5703908.1 hypothetical protein [Brucella daejeonensis]
MKFGVLTFGYNSLYFDAFRKKREQDGYYDVNLGDNAQSIAVRNLYKQSGISDDQIVEVDREALCEYTGPKTIVIMNGVFYSDTFPISDSIIPIFIGFHTTKDVIREQRDFFLRHQPIGCRDDGTTAAMQEFGIEAFTTGCLTLTLPPRESKPQSPKLLVVYGSGAGYLPPAVFHHTPEHLLANAQFIYHRLPAMRFPFDAQLREEAERYERALMARYRQEATLVLTPLHHVATPCLAFGIPVIICRVRNDVRFSMVDKLLPIHTPASFSEIDWNPPAVNIDSIRDELIRLVKARLMTVSQGK